MGNGGETCVELNVRGVYFFVKSFFFPLMKKKFYPEVIYACVVSKISLWFYLGELNILGKNQLIVEKLFKKMKNNKKVAFLCLGD